MEREADLELARHAAILRTRAGEMADPEHRRLALAIADVLDPPADNDNRLVDMRLPRFGSHSLT